MVRRNRASQIIPAVRYVMYAMIEVTSFTENMTLNI